jgi:hypothetical protein
MKSASWKSLSLGALLFAGLALSGCNGDTINQVGGGSLLLLGNFPGTQITQHFVSDDGRAFTHSSAKVNKGLQVFWNCSNGHAIVLYADSFERLWAHYYDGTNFTPGVEIAGVGQRSMTLNDSPARESRSDDNWYLLEQVRVLFLNTTGAANANASARNGDALILFVREDEEPSNGGSGGNGLDPDADENDRLYGTYFDFSDRASAVSSTDPTVHYGFETVATILDFDNKQAGETADDDVTTFGFVSDSLKYSHAYDIRQEGSSEDPSEYLDARGSDLALMPATRSGDPTSFVFLVWRKAQNESVGIPAMLSQTGGSSVQRRWHYLNFDLTAAGNALPVQAANGANTFPLPAGMTIADGTSVDEEAVVHNGSMIWRVEIEDEFTATGVFLTTFGAGMVPSTIELSQSVTDTVVSTSGFWNNTSANMPRAGNVYGGDHGLTALYAVFDVSGSPSRLAASKVNLDATPAREIENIEAAGDGGISTLDGTRIARNSDWIQVLWQQAPPPVMSGLTTGSRQIYANVIQTRTSATARTLADSLATTADVPNQNNDPSDPDFIAFQSEIADGTSAPICGVQSNRNRLNFAWTEVAGSVATLIHNGTTVTLGGTPTTAPTFVFAVTGSSEGKVGNSHTSYVPYDSTTGLCAVVTDLGTADGSPLLYFLQNANNPTDNAAAGAFDEVRVHGNAGIPGTAPSDARVVSTDGSGQDRAMNDAFLEDTRIDDLEDDAGRFLRVQTAPLSTAAGNHSGTVVHLFMREPRGGATALKADLVTRRFVKASFSAASATATFATAHVPALSSMPTSLMGLANHDAFIEPNAFVDGDEIGPKTTFTTVSGSNVGVYFRSDWHWHYQEFDGTAWLFKDGVAAPEPIDNATSNSLFFGRDQQSYPFARRLNGQCDNGAGVLCFFSTWLDGDDIGLRRWFVRVHE